MPDQSWTAVDRYLTDLFVPPDDVLDTVLGTSAAAGLPEIQVSPAQGKLLHVLARSHGVGSIFRSARWAVIARSGLRGRCRRMGGFLR